MFHNPMKNLFASWRNSQNVNCMNTMLPSTIYLFFPRLSLSLSEIVSSCCFLAGASIKGVMVFKCNSKCNISISSTNISRCMLIIQLRKSQQLDSVHLNILFSVRNISSHIQVPSSVWQDLNLVT